MRLDERRYSPELQRRLVETAAQVKSFTAAAAVAELWSDRPICSRTTGRIAGSIGSELTARRDAMVDDFTHHRRQPEGEDSHHALAVVFVDGGRVQLREEPSKPGVHGERWAEDKFARLQTMESEVHLCDPCPPRGAADHEQPDRIASQGIQRTPERGARNSGTNRTRKRCWN